MPRQDSSYDQMLDVLAAVRDAGHQLAAGWMHEHFFAYPPAAAAPMSDELRAQLQAASAIAAKAGCYDADDWLRRARA